jgi:hypothetical protein
MHVDRSITADQTVAVLDQLAAARGAPKHIRCDEVVRDPNAGDTDRRLATLALLQPRDSGLASAAPRACARPGCRAPSAARRARAVPRRPAGSSSRSRGSSRAATRPRASGQRVRARPRRSSPSARRRAAHKRRRPAFGPSRPRSSGRPSPGLGLRCEEGRGSFEQIALLLEALDLPAQLAQLSRSALVRPSSRSRASSWVRLTQSRNDCCETPSASATSLTERPERTICTASRRNSPGYAGLVLGIDEHHPFATCERKPQRVHQNGGSPLFSEEQARIKRERADTEVIVARLTVSHDDLLEMLALALRLASFDLQDLYLRATPQIRRLMNQAISEALWISHDEVERSRLASPLRETHALARAVGRIPAATGTADPGNRKAPDLGSEALDGGWIRTEMVELAGLEPATFALPARRSPN